MSDQNYFPTQNIIGNIGLVLLSFYNHKYAAFQTLCFEVTLSIWNLFLRLKTVFSHILTILSNSLAKQLLIFYFIIVFKFSKNRNIFPKNRATFQKKFGVSRNHEIDVWNEFTKVSFQKSASSIEQIVHKFRYLKAIK